MGWFNRLEIRQLQRSEALIKKRIAVANQAIDLLESEKTDPRDVRMMRWQLHKARLLNKLADLALRVSVRVQQERQH